MVRQAHHDRLKPFALSLSKGQIPTNKKESDCHFRPKAVGSSGESSSPDSPETISLLCALCGSVVNLNFDRIFVSFAAIRGIRFYFLSNSTWKSRILAFRSALSLNTARTAMPGFNSLVTLSISERSIPFKNCAMGVLDPPRVTKATM